MNRKYNSNEIYNLNICVLITMYIYFVHQIFSEYLLVTVYLCL